MFWVYVLKCNNGKHYTGHTDNLEKRINEHNTGATKGYTAGKGPFELTFCQSFGTRVEALTAEMKIKKRSRAKKQALRHGDWNAIKHLSKKKFK